MDPFDATSVLFTRIKSLDPENAPKIMGYILIQDLPQRDLMRLAFGPDHLLHSFVVKAKTHLGLPSTTFSAPAALSPHSPLIPIPRPPNNAPQNPLSHSSPRIPTNGFLDFAKNPSWSSPSSTPKSSPFLSYENIRSGSLLAPPLPHLTNGNCAADNSSAVDFLDEQQMSDYLSFLNDSSSKNEDFVDPRAQYGFSVNNGDTHLHRRSFSASDACFGSEDAAFGAGYKPCLYFARGFCKNGDNCKFVHGDFADNVDVNGVVIGSPSKMDLLYHQQEEMMRMRAVHQQRLAAAQFMAGVSSLPYEKRANLLLQQQNDSQRAAALMLGEEIYKFGHGRPDRNELLAMGLAEKANSAARQIYLTFPADSTFKDEDVSNYFSMYGPVQDVRIPYQAKRMFGFVTFVHPETVKLILSRGNPHFICDSRVLVKPYKEKGKIPEKRQYLQQQLERGNYSPSSNPGPDSRESYDLNLGPKMLYSAQEMILRRKLEEEHADLQQAIELQRRRLMNLQLPDFKNDPIHHHHHQRSLSVGSPLSLPAHSHVNQSIIFPTDSINQEVTEVNGDKTTVCIPSTVTAAEQELSQEVSLTSAQNSGDDAEEGPIPERHDVPERSGENDLEHALPDSFFASPIKSACHRSDLSSSVNVSESAALSATSSSENNPVPTCSTGDIVSL